MTVLYFILLIGVLIFVHEFGHFMFAKLFDVKVLKFSLGFGPRAAGFRRGETEYIVAWLPLGGYVKMLGEDPNDEIGHQDQGRAFHQKPLWQRYIIVFAGPAFNLIFPTLIYLLFYATQTTLPPPVIGKVFAGQPAAEAGLQPGDKVVSIDGARIRYWEQMQRVISGRPETTLRLTIERDGKRFDRLVKPQVFASKSRLGLMQREGRIGIANYFELAQIGVTPRSAAERAGLRTGDLITAVNGVGIERWADLERLLARNSGAALRVSFLRPADSLSAFVDVHPLMPATAVVDPEARGSAGSVRYETGIESAEFFVREVEAKSPVDKLGIKPGDKIVSFNGQPLTHWEAMRQVLQARMNDTHTIGWIDAQGRQQSRPFKLARVTYLDEYRQEQERFVFGARNRLLRKVADPVPIEGRLTYAVTEAVRRTSEIVGVIAIAVVQYIRGAIPRDSIGGPVMLFQTAGVAAAKGWDHFLSMMALISINLGMLNLLPIPILDGGHLMFLSIEAVKRKPLSLRAREVASYVGLFLLVSLMIFACKNDIVRYWFK